MGDAKFEERMSAMEGDSELRGEGKNHDGQ